MSARGFETGSGPAASEFICQIADNSSAFALDVSGGLDGSSFFFARETGGDPRIDALDTGEGAFVPGRIAVPAWAVWAPRSIVPGENGLLCMLGDETDMAAVDPHRAP